MKTAREVIASSTQMCEYAVKASSPHDHARCLQDADELIASLRLAGYEVLGVAELGVLAVSPDCEAAK